MLLGSSISFAQVRYPVHGTVQVLPPYGLYLSDYYGGSQDRLVVTLLNRDLEQPLLQARLRVRVKNGMNFSLESREEIVYPILELTPNVPLRLTSIDIAPYLQPDHIRLSGRLDNGRLPVGMTEFSVQVVEYHTGRPLSAWHTGRAWLDIKNPPILNYPRPNEVIPYHEPFTQVQFQWMPRHQGVSGTEYEFVLKELPDNGIAPQSAFAYGIEIYRTRQRQTRLTYSVMEPLLEKNKRYGWQVRAVAVAGIDEIGMFANNGFTEIGWFEVRETVSAPTGLTGNAGYGKVDLKWSGSPNHQGYIIQYHPITAGDDEWVEARSYNTFSTLNGMKLGVKYEIRVGAYGSDQRYVFCLPIEVTIPSVNESRLAECGKGLNLPERIQEPITNLQVGDTITIGPDFKMVATELHALGDGWYSGKGSTLLTWIFESRIAVHFDRLRVNVQREQIDGEVFTDYDDTESQIANSDRIDDGGSGTHRVEIEVPTTSVDFVMPDMPEGSTYDATTGSLTIYDTNGEVHNVPIPKNESGEPTFPMLIKDSSGQTYEVNESDESTAEEETSDDSTGRTDDRKKKGPRPVQIKKVEQITDFNREGLDSECRLRFSGEGSRYAFDNGEEAWYQSAVKLDSYYKPLDKNGYIAPWKLIPVGEKDVVKVTCSDPSVDATTVRFVLENGDIVPAKYDNTNREWRLELPSVESGEEYAVYGLVDGKTAGKLRVVSYPKQRHEVTLVQTNDYAPDVKAVESELNAIYNPIGIAFTVHTDTLFNKSWDLNGDGLLSIEGKTLFGKSVDVKESKEMRALQRLYASTTKREGICIFSLDGEQGVHKSSSLLGEMPRNSRYGYVFTSSTPSTKQLAHTIAHELGHGLFTLQHTFDDEYGGTKSQGTTDNLMDYGTGTDLVAFQWNIMSKPAIFTALDKADEVALYGKIWFTPDWQAFKFDESKTIVGNNTNAGTVPGIVYNKKHYKYDYDKKAYICRGEPALPIEIVNLRDTSTEEVYLFGVTHDCKAPTYSTTYKYAIAHKSNIDYSDTKNVHPKEVWECAKEPATTHYFKIDRTSLEYVEYAKKLSIKVEDGLSKNKDCLDNLLIEINKQKSTNDKSVDILGAVLADKLKTYELFNAKKFIVAFAETNHLSESQSDWQELAQSLFDRANLGANDILITIPYVILDGLLTDGRIYYMPGIAKGSAVEHDASTLGSDYSHTQEKGKYRAGSKPEGVYRFIFDVFRSTKKKVAIYRGFYNASNVIDIIPYYDEESNYPFNKAIFAYKQKGCEELAQLYVKEQRDIKNAMSQRYGQDRRSPIEIAKMQDLIHLAAKREQLQLLEQLSNQVSLSDFEPWAVSSPIEYKEEFIEQVNKNEYKNYEAYLSLYAYEDLRAQLQYPKVGGFDFDQEATFTDKTDWWLSSYVDKPVYNTLDLASVVLGVFSLDVIPDALNLGYSLVRRDYDNAIGSGLSLLIIGPTGYASKTTIPRGLKYLRRSENGVVIAVDNSDEELRSIIRKSKKAFGPGELDNLDNASRDELWRLANRENLFENLDKWLNEVPQNVKDIIRDWDNDYKLLLNKDLSSNSTGAELKSLLASAENVEIWKYLKDDPAYAFELAKDNKDWERWSKINFFKDITKRGKKFESAILNKMITRSGEEYNALKALVPD